MQNYACASCCEPYATKRCSACKAAHYCNADCQKTHWPIHKTSCQRITAINGMCKVTIKLLHEWHFLPLCGVQVNMKDSNVLVGEFVHDQPVKTYECGPAMKIEDWVFVMQRALTDFNARLKDPLKWYVCAYHGDMHYNLGAVDSQLEKPHEQLVDFVFPRVWKLFSSENCTPDVNGFVKVNWSIVPLI